MQLLEWRRSQVLELSAQGLNQTEISGKLQVHPSVISRDFKFLREIARVNLQEHLDPRIPEEYQRCMNGINQVLKMSWKIANSNFNSESNNNDNDKKSTTTTVDDKTRIQALALASDCYKYKMDLVTNSVVITDAIKFVQQKKEELLNMTKQSEDRSNGKTKNLTKNADTNNVIF